MRQMQCECIDMCSRLSFRQQLMPFFVRIHCCLVLVHCWLQDQMDSLPYLCRFQYAETAEYLTSLTDPLIAAYQGFGGSAAGQVRFWWLPSHACCLLQC